MHMQFYFDHPDGRRALLVVVDKTNLHRVRLIIRGERGNGPVILCRTYTTERGARAALRRRGSGWTCTRKKVWIIGGVKQ